MIPVLIEEMIAKLSDPKVPPHIKENYANSLMKIEDAIKVALQKHSKTKHFKS